MNIHKLLFSGVLAVGLAACGGDKKPDDAASATPPTDAASVPPTDAASAPSSAAADAASSDAASSDVGADDRPSYHATQPNGPRRPVPTVKAIPGAPAADRPPIKIAVDKTANRCRGIPTTNWTARTENGQLTVALVAQVPAGAYNLKLINNGPSPNRPDLLLIGFVANPQGQGAGSAQVPVRLTMAKPAAIKSVEISCEGNLILRTHIAQH